MPIEYRATEMSDIAAASAGTARDARHLVTGRRRVPYSCNLHRNAPNIGHCEHPNVVPMRAWHRGNRPFVRLNVRGSTSPSNDDCSRRLRCTTGYARTRTDCRRSQFDPTRKVEPLRSSRSTTTIQARKIIDVVDRGPSSAAPPCGVGCTDWLAGC